MKELPLAEKLILSQIIITCALLITAIQLAMNDERFQEIIRKLFIASCVMLAAEAIAAIWGIL
jgi:hypothetical protein